MDVNNLMLLQKQSLKLLKIMMIVMDCLWVFLFLILLGAGEPELFWGFGGLLIVVVLLHFMLWEARKPSASLKRLPPEVLSYVNAHCLTGLRFGNGVLCDNDCLVLIGNVVVTAVMLRDVTRMELRRTGRGMIYLEGEESPGAWISDPRMPLMMQGLLWQNNSNRGVINGAERRVKGAGTFREVDRDTFWRALCGAWRKYTDTEPIVS